MDFEKEFLLAKSVAYEVGKFLGTQDQVKIDSSEGKDIKLELDQIAEKKIISSITNNSNFGILSEEAGVNGDLKGNAYWIIDPIDGSLNFSRGFPISCVSIALWKETEPIFGVVYDFNNHEMFSGYVGKGTWFGDKKIDKPLVKETKDAILATGIPTYLEINEALMEEYLKLFAEHKKIRMIGSAALSICYAALGRVDRYYEKNIKLWDIAAGIAIIKSLEMNYSISIEENYLTITSVGFN